MKGRGRKNFVTLLAVLFLVVTAGGVTPVKAEDDITWGSQYVETFGTESTLMTTYGVKFNGVKYTDDSVSYQEQIYVKIKGSASETAERKSQMVKIEPKTTGSLRWYAFYKISGSSTGQIKSESYSLGTYYAIINPETETIIQLSTRERSYENQAGIELAYPSGPYKDPDYTARITILHEWSTPTTDGSTGGGVWTQDQITTLLAKIDSTNAKQDDIISLLEEIRDQGTTQPTTEQDQTVAVLKEKGEALSESTENLVSQESAIQKQAIESIDAVDPAEMMTAPQGLINAFEWIRRMHAQTVERSQLTILIGFSLALGLAALIIGRRNG